MGGEQRKSQDNSIWDPVFSFVNNTGTYTCKANNSLGQSETSNNKEVVVQGEFTLEQHSNICICIVDLYYSQTSLMKIPSNTPVSHYIGYLKTGLHDLNHLI